MKLDIKKFEFKDYELIKSWWDKANEVAPVISDIPETSYMAYINDKPILSVSVYLTNGPIAWIDNFIGNPELKGSVRKEAGVILLSHLEKIAKEHNKNRMFCMSMNDNTAKRYQELGFTKTASNISTFVKGVV